MRGGEVEDILLLNASARQTNHGRVKNLPRVSLAYRAMCSSVREHCSIEAPLMGNTIVHDARDIFTPASRNLYTSGSGSR